jgi:hypothetical protein
MKDHFENDANFLALELQLEEWRGTPFAQGEAIPGRGVDCVRFIEAVLVGCGAIKPVPMPPYTCRGGGPEMLAAFLQVMAAIPEMTPIWSRSSGAPPPPPARGRVLLVSSGKALHHLAILAEPPTVWHCFDQVTEGNWHEPKLLEHLHTVYCVTEREEHGQII